MGLAEILCAAVMSISSMYNTDTACKYMDEVVEVSQKWDIEPEIFIALIYTESRWTPRAKSRANACGLTQVIPKWTGGRATGGRKYTCKELYDPVTSIRAGGQILNTWLYRYGRGDYKIGLCGYNAGYRCKGKNPNLKGKRYARIVLKRAKRIKQAVRKIKRENNRARVEE